MMTGWNFADELCETIRRKKSILGAGLDPNIQSIPPHLVCDAMRAYGRTCKALEELIFEFNCQIIKAIHDLVVCVKPQMAFYIQYGSHGIRALERTMAYAHNMGLLVVLDTKANDGGDSANAFADAFIGKIPFFPKLNRETQTAGLEIIDSPLRADCVTTTPYIGEDLISRLVQRVKQYGTSIFVVCKTSFKPNSAVEQLVTESGLPVWQEVADMVNEWGEGTEGSCRLRNVGVVMGATYPEDAPRMRELLPNSIFLIPGFGSQGGAADDAVVGIRDDGLGGIVNDSRSLLYAWQKGKFQCESEKFADAARLRAIEGRDMLVQACKKADKWPF